MAQSLEGRGPGASLWLGRTGVWSDASRSLSMTSPPCGASAIQAELILWAVVER